VTGVRKKPRRAAGKRWFFREFNRRHIKEYLVFLAFIAPNVILIALFVYRPLFSNMYYSLLNWTLGSTSATVVGLQNYIDFFTQPESWSTLRITAIFVFFGVFGSMAIGLLIAVALNRKLPGSTFARAAVFSPYVLSGVGVGIVWLFIFDPVYGALSPLLRYVGVNGPNWYLSPTWALVMVIIVYVWKNTGYAAVIYLAGLQAVPNEILEAAAVDGAGKFVRFRRIVFPLLSPTTFFLLVTITLSSLQSFDIIQIMTRGGPLFGTRTLVYDIYYEAFVAGRAGYSAAVSVILFLILFVLTVLQMRYLEKRVHYT
jgi:sn-glycerol 3-phosphate transport system permease protein